MSVLFGPTQAQAAVVSGIVASETHLGPVVSGTGVRLAWWASAGSNPGQPPAYLAYAEVEIGGQVAESWTYTEADAVGGIEPPVRVWDSTHFAHNSEVLVRIRALSTLGEETVTSFTVVPYNRTHVHGNEHLTQAAAATATAATGFNGAGYTSTAAGAHLTQDKGAILLSIQESTVFYSWTHGTPDGFADSFWQDNPLNWILPVEVAVAVAGKLAGQPPVSFVFSDACHTALNNLLAEAFFGTTVGLENRAFFGFADSVQDSSTAREWSASFLTKLLAGKTVIEAKVAMWMENLSEPKNTAGNTVAKIIHGDEATKIKGAYGSPDTRWYLKIEDLP